MKTILVIEDSQEVRENISEILELSSYKVITAEEGKTGVEIALRERPDLIVCDIMMPVLDGYGVLHLLNKHEETYGIPFIFLTAKSDKSDFRKGMEMGADDYITKPFDGIELLSAIEIRLKKSENLKKFVSSSSDALNMFIKNAGKNANIRLISDERETCFYGKKRLIYVEGQKPKSVYCLLSGKIKTYRVNEDGKEFITNIYAEQDFFGYSALLEEVNYTDNAEVLEDATLMLIPSEDFISLLTTDAQVSRQFIKMIAKNILEKEQTLVNLAYSSLRKKVAFGLVQIIDRYKKDNKEQTVIELSRENFAQVVGVATESLIRTLADFKSEGMINLQTGKITIMNEKKLRELPY
jgi:CheY-like chemotaxis protein